MTIEIEGKIGEHVSEAANRAIKCLLTAREPVELKFNDIVVQIAHGMSAADVCADYDRQGNERRAAYLASPEYAKRRREADEAARKKAAEYEMAILTAPLKMRLRDPEGWEMARAANRDGYGNAVMVFAERWACLMEGAMRDGAALAECAEKTSSLADTDGITGFMYGAAVNTLARVWEHGEELRRWHNIKTQVRDEGEKANESGGVLNPAMLRLG